jgi:hypothetical protein
MIQWIRNYLSDIKITWMLVRYKRRNTYDYLQQDQDLRAQHRAQMWQQERVHNSRINDSISDIHVPYRDTSSELFPQNDDEDDGYEYSNGTTGMRIVKRIDAGSKAIGLCRRFEDLFYVMTKNIDERSYHNFIYLDKDGMDKRDFDVEIIGVDLV